MQVNGEISQTTLYACLVVGIYDGPTLFAGGFEDHKSVSLFVSGSDAF
jgi:hypothetical protein